MYILFPVIIAIVMIILLLKFKKKLNKITHIVNLILFSILILQTAIYISDSLYTNSLRSKYLIKGESLFGSMNYEGEKEGYYLVSSSNFLGGSTDYAIPVEDTKISPISKIYKPIKICYIDDPEHHKPEFIEIDGEEYIIERSVAKIIPEYTVASFILGLIDALIIGIFNLVVLIIFIVLKIENRNKLNSSQV